VASGSLEAQQMRFFQIRNDVEDCSLCARPGDKVSEQDPICFINLPGAESLALGSEFTPGRNNRHPRALENWQFSHPLRGDRGQSGPSQQSPFTRHFLALGQISATDPDILPTVYSLADKNIFPGGV